MSYSHWGMFFGVMVLHDVNGCLGRAGFEPRHPDEMCGNYW